MSEMIRKHIFFYGRVQGDSGTMPPIKPVCWDSLAGSEIWRMAVWKWKYREARTRSMN